MRKLFYILSSVIVMLYMFLINLSSLKAKYIIVLGFILPVILIVFLLVKARSEDELTNNK